MSVKLFGALIFMSFCSTTSFSQSTISGLLTSEDMGLAYVKVGIKELNLSKLTNAYGEFKFEGLNPGIYTLIAQSIEFETLDTVIILENRNLNLNLIMKPNTQYIEEVVVSGSLKEVSKLNTTTVVEIYNSNFFKHNPTNNLLEGLQNINGIRPQINCNICNTGDIHINGLEGPYTMILIDGIPSVSNLSSVYGLSGIPMALIDRIEIIRGPASSLYGSEAIGGIINVITKSPEKAPLFSVDVNSNTWLETSVDVAAKHTIGKKIIGLSGINYFNYSNPIDNNQDNFTDLTLQHRISIFEKIKINRLENRLFSLAARYLYEDRWGGEMNWNRTFRGGDSIYGESIYTNRWELFGNYELPFKEKFITTFSVNNHRQNSYYGTTSFNAAQFIAFGQVTYYKTIKSHDLLAGISYRLTRFDDNTPATLHEDSIQNQPSNTQLPGIFLQDEWKINGRLQLLVGFRYDYNQHHGSIYTPRIGTKFNITEHHQLRLNGGTGYRVVNVFTEDHAALTGARKTEIKESLNPEKSYNVNLNYYGISRIGKQSTFTIDCGVFYTFFNNKITPDYFTDPNKIIYANSEGYAESKGANLNLSLNLKRVSIQTGATIMDVTQTTYGKTTRQILSERFSGTWTISVPIKRLFLSIDYTGNIYSPMILPTLGSEDPRSTNSPWWSIQNIKFEFTKFKQVSIYCGVKNLLNWLPSANEPFIIARSNDPFDKQVHFAEDGTVIADDSNPYGLTFDPTYVYGPNQGIRFFMGIRWEIFKD